MSIETDDAASAQSATAPRVTLQDITDAIASVYYTDGYTLAAQSALVGHKSLVKMDLYDNMGVLTVCVVLMKNGFVVIGKAAPASPANFDRELGRKFAYEDAIRQLWPHMGFALKDRVYRGFEAAPTDPGPPVVSTLDDNAEPLRVSTLTGVTSPSSLPPAVITQPQPELTPEEAAAKRVMTHEAIVDRMQRGVTGVTDDIPGNG